jgi:hypothetical protein
MADSTDALLEIVYEFAATHKVRFEPAALSACRDIFERTVGNFARQAADQSVAEHPWDNEDFRKFILGQVKRVAVEANAMAKSAPVSAAVLRSAAFDVMKDTNRVCRLMADRGRIKFETAERPKHYEGEVCSAFLEGESRSVTPDA